jgi:hypothetical protein
MRIRVVMADGSQLPWHNPGDHLSVAIVSLERGDAFAYNIDGFVKEDGVRTFGYVPPGHYTIKASLHSSIEERRGDRPPENLSMWEAESREIEIAGDTEVVLKLSRSK